MSIITRKGDSGHTDLLFGARVSKSHPRIRAIGAVDELNAALGLLRVHALCAETHEIIDRVQPQLISLMGELATPAGSEAQYESTHASNRMTDEHVSWLDARGALFEREGTFQFAGWVLPGAARSAAGAHADFARTICRRAEITVQELSETPDALPGSVIPRYLNRLSDVLWLAARWEERPQSAMPGAD